ncbi:MAG TPA: hypothetical protein VGP69_12010 [Gaiellaceae bacterium]|nr:hypothetical protein [Gaiellaceae bacterium]
MVLGDKRFASSNYEFCGIAGVRLGVELFSHLVPAQPGRDVGSFPDEFRSMISQSAIIHSFAENAPGLPRRAVLQAGDA